MQHVEHNHCAIGTFYCQHLTTTIFTLRQHCNGYTLVAQVHWTFTTTLLLFTPLLWLYYTLKRILGQLVPLCTETRSHTGRFDPTACHALQDTSARRLSAIERTPTPTTYSQPPAHLQYSSCTPIIRLTIHEDSATYVHLQGNKEGSAQDIRYDPTTCSHDQYDVHLTLTDWTKLALTIDYL